MGGSESQGGAGAAASSDTSTISVRDVFGILFKSLRDKEEHKEERNDILRRYLREELSKHEVATEHNLLIMHDEAGMIRADIDRVYAAVTSFDDEKPLLLILYSSGGDIGSAYLIGQLCREYAHGKFIVVVPRRAKSAGTLICCAADEIHMGSLSELGPIDPQIEGLPALGLKSSVQHLAALAEQHPGAAEMFARYLHLSLQPVHLGFYERVAESAVQYAVRLLEPHKSGLPKRTKDIAEHLVYSYKDHGFVIDKSEAKEVFGANVVFVNTGEYSLGNAIYRVLSLFGSVATYCKYIFYWIGSPDSDPQFIRKSSS